MKHIVRDKLFEDPDTSYAKDSQPLQWSDDAHPFGWNSQKGIIEVGDLNDTHDSVGISSAFAFEDYQGRIWPEAGVISFWEAPPKVTLLKILKELQMHDEISVYELEMEDYEDFLFDVPNPDLSADDEDAIYTLSEYPDNPIPSQWKSKIKRPEHTASPMNKEPQKVKVSDNIGKKVDDRNAWRRSKPFESAVRPTVNESPDTMCASPRPTVSAWGKYLDSWHCVDSDEEVAKYSDKDARPFGIINPITDYRREEAQREKMVGKMWIGEKGETHGWGGRQNFQYGGRVWMDKFLFSFWEYPSPEKMNEFIYELAKEFKNTTEFPQQESVEKIAEHLSNFLVEIIEKSEDKNSEDKKEVWKTAGGEWDTWGKDPKERFSTKYIKVKNYEKLSDVKQMDPKDLAGEHGKSPMDPTKKKRAVPHGFGSKHPEAEGRAEERRDKPFESLITESPDGFGYDGNYHDVYETGALAFEAKVYDDEIMDVMINPTPGYHGDSKETTAGSDRIYPGRLFNKPKIFTFWAYPNKEDFEKMINILEKKMDQKLWNNGWKIEVYLDEDGDTINPGEKRYGNNYDRNSNNKDFVPIEKYMGSVGPPAEERQKHLMTYKEKLAHKKATGWGKGSGSEKYGKKKPLPYRQAMYAESVEENLNENPNATIDPKIWDKYKDQPTYTPDKLEFDQEGNIVFGYYGGKLYTRKGKSTHPQLYRIAMSDPDNELTREDKERGKNSGRIFTNQKLLTFWVFPENQGELLKILADLENKTKLNIINDPEWRIEIPAGEFKKALTDDQGSWGSWYPRIGQMEMVPIKDYKGDHTRSEEDMGQQHAFSPMDPRKKKRKVWKSKSPSGIDRLKIRQAMYAESFYPRLK